MLPDDPNAYLYHVTFSGRLGSIAERGLRPGAPRSIGTMSYAFNRKGRIFFTTREGGFYWWGKSEDNAEALSDTPIEDGFTPVVLRVAVANIRVKIEVDTVANLESIYSHAVFVAGIVPPDLIEVWDGDEWLPVDQFDDVVTSRSYLHVEEDGGEWDSLRDWRMNPLFPQELHP